MIAAFRTVPCLGQCMAGSVQNFCAPECGHCGAFATGTEAEPRYVRTPLRIVLDELFHRRNSE